MKNNFIAIGLMSGTSIDGIDISIIETNGIDKVKIIANSYYKYQDNFRNKIKNIINNNLSYYQIEHEITLLHADLIYKTLKENHLTTNDIDVIGFHGHTIHHEKNITVQIGNGILLSSLTKTDVVYDFRKRDLAEGGNGAPLAPIYHQALFNTISQQEPIIIMNIGGVSNITYLYQDQVIAFDCGIGNALMDDYIYKKNKKYYDYNGDIAGSGNINLEIIDIILQDSFFIQKEAKSLDRNYFYKYQSHLDKLNFEDCIATLNFLIAKSLEISIKNLPQTPKKIILCGGGRYNKTIIKNIEKLLNIQINKIDDFNINGDYVESQAFAYLAVRHLKKLPITFNTTTGVKNNNFVSGIISKY